MGIAARFGNVLVGLGLLTVEEMENNNPKAMLALAVQKQRDATASYLKQLGDAAGFAKRLSDQVAGNIQQIEANKKRIKQLLDAVAKSQATVDALLASGDAAKVTQGTQLKLACDGDRSKAAALASSTKTMVENLDENKAQAAQAEQTYLQRKREYEGWDRMTREKIEGIRSLIGETEMAEAQAELAKMASPINFDANSSLNSVEESLKRRKASAQGAVRVASEAIQSNPYLVSQAEQEARDSSALADFEAEFAAESAPKA